MEKFSTNGLIQTLKIRRQELICEREPFWNEFKKLNYEDFKTALKQAAEFEQYRLNKEVGYYIDEFNLSIIRKLFSFITDYKPGQKGIMLCGGYDTGKTLLMRSFKIFMDHYSIKFKSKRWFYLKSDSEDFSSKMDGVAIIDEICREEITVNDYGTIKTPFVKYLIARHERGLITFGISNFSETDMKKHYGNYVSERLTEMFEFVEIKGKHYRK